MELNLQDEIGTIQIQFKYNLIYIHYIYKTQYNPSLSHARNLIKHSLIL